MDRWDRRRALGVGLLLFSLVSFAVALRDTLRDFATPSPGGAPASPASSGRHQAIYLLYGNAKCPTCDDIMKLTEETLREDFVAPRERGEIVFSSANVEEAGNEWYVSTFEIFSTSVVLALYDQGRLVTWKNPQEVWDLAADPAAFKAFLRREIQSMLSFSPQGSENPGAAASEDHPS